PAAEGAAAAEGAGGGSADASGGGGGEGAAPGGGPAGGGAAGAASMGDALGGAEGHRAEAVAAYEASNASLLSAAEGASRMRGGTEFGASRGTGEEITARHGALAPL